MNRLVVTTGGASWTASSQKRGGMDGTERQTSHTHTGQLQWAALVVSKRSLFDGSGACMKKGGGNTRVPSVYCLHQTFLPCKGFFSGRGHTVGGKLSVLPREGGRGNKAEGKTQRFLHVDHI